MGAVMTANFILVGVTAVLLSVLLVLYGRMLKQAFTRFTAGLLLFAGALWFQAVVQLYCFATMMPLYAGAGGLEVIVLVQNALALVASAVLLAVTVDPVGSARDAPETA